MTSKPSRVGKKRSPSEIAETKRLFSIIAMSLMAIGLVLIIASFGARAIPRKAVWSEEQAIAHQKASKKYHSDQFDQTITKSELEASRKEFEVIDEQLDRAKYKRSGLPKVLRWIGIGSAGVGYVVLLIIRSNDD